MRGKASEYRARVTVLQQKLQMEQMAAMASGAQMARGAPRWRLGKVPSLACTHGGVLAVGAVAGAVLMGPITAVAAGRPRRTRRQGLRRGGGRGAGDGDGGRGRKIQRRA